MGLLNPSEATAGLMSDTEVLIKTARWGMFDYQGKSDPAPTLVLTCEVDDADDHVEYLSAGSADKWEPSEDGHTLRAIGTATHLSKQCKAVRFLKSLVDCGFPSDKLGDDPAVLEGLRVHVIRVPDTSRTFRDTGETKQGSDVLVVDKIIALPGSGKGDAGKKQTKKGAASGGGKKEPADASALSEAASQYVVDVLASAGTPVPKNQLVAKAYQAGLKEDANKAEIIKLLMSDEFLGSGAWTYADGSLSL